MENRIVDEEQKETLSMSKMFDVEMNLESAEYSKVKKKRRSSILKPPRVPLQDIDLNVNDGDGEGRRKKKRSSRRVSFADTFQIVEFHTENKDYDISKDNKVETEDEANIKDADNQVFLENDKQEDEFLLPFPTELLNPVLVGENILLAKSMSRNSESNGKRTTEDQSKKETENNNLESPAIPNLTQKPSKTMFDLYMTATYDSHISTDYETLWHTSLNKYSYCGNFEPDQVSLESEKEEICNTAREEGETAEIISEIEAIEDFLKSRRESSSLLTLVSKPILSTFPEVGSSDSTVKETSDFGRRIPDHNFDSKKQKPNSVFDRLNETCVLPTDMNITCLDDSFKEQSFQPGLFSTSFAKYPEVKQNKKIATNVIKQHRYKDAHPKVDAYSLGLGKGKQYVEQNATAQDSSVSSDLEKICTKLTDIAVLCKGEELMPSINMPAFSSGKEDESMQMTCALPTALHNLYNLNRVLNINTSKVQNETVTNLNTSCTDMDLTCESLGNCVNQSRFPHVMENIFEKKETNSEGNHPSIKNLEYDTCASVSNCARKNNSVPNLLFCNENIVPENNVKRNLNEAINSFFHSKSIQNNYSPDITEKVQTNKFNLSTHADTGLTHVTLNVDCNKDNMLIISKEKPESTEIKQKRNDVSDFIHNRSATFSVVPNLICNSQNSSDSMHKSDLNAEENFKEILQSFCKSEIISQVSQNSKISPQTTPTLSNGYDSEFSKSSCLRDQIIRELPCLNTETAEILPFTKLPENLSDTWQNLAVSKQQSGLLHNIKTGYQEEDMEMTCAVFLRNQTHEREENFDTGVTIQTNVLQKDANLPSTISKIKQNNIANEIKVDKKVQDKLPNHAYCKETMFFPSSTVLMSEDMEETRCFHTEIEMPKSLNPIKPENSKKLSNVFECYPVYFNVSENNRAISKSSTLNDQALNFKKTSYGADDCENEKILSDNFISIDNSSSLLNNTSSEEEEESDRTIYFDKQIDFTCNLRGENIVQNISVDNYNKNTSVYVEQNSSEKTFEDLQNPDAVGNNSKLQHNEQVTVNNKVTNSALWKDKFDLKGNCSLYNQNKSVCNSGIELTAVNQKSVCNKKPSETRFSSSADMEMTCAIRPFEGDEEATNHIVSSQLIENMCAIGETSECTKNNAELFHIDKETSGANNICSEQRQNFEQNSLNNQDAFIMQRNKSTLCNTVTNEVISKDREINADASAKMNYENLSASRTFCFDKQVEFTCNLKGESNAQNVIVHNDEKNTSIYAAKYSSEKNSEAFQNLDTVKDSFKLQHNKQVTINNKVRNETLDKGEFISKGNCSLYDQNKSVYDNDMELTLVNCKSLYSKEATEKTQYFSSVGMEITCDNRQFHSDTEITGHDGSSQLIENMHGTVGTIECTKHTDNSFHVTEETSRDNICSAQKENFEISSLNVQDFCTMQRNKNALCNTVITVEKLNDVTTLNQRKQTEIDTNTPKISHESINASKGKLQYNMKFMAERCGYMKSTKLPKNNASSQKVHTPKKNSETAAKSIGDFYRSLSKRTRVINLRDVLHGKHNRKIETADINDSFSIRNENSVLHCLDHASLQEKPDSSVHHSSKVDQECSFQHNSEQKLQCISENSITLGTELMITDSSEKNGDANDQKESTKIENFKKIPRKPKLDILYKIKQAKKLALEQGYFNFQPAEVSSESVKQLSSSSSNASCKVVSEMGEREKDFDPRNSYIQNSGTVLRRKAFLYETNIAFANDSASSLHVSNCMDKDEILDVNIMPMEDIKSNTDVHNYSGIESLNNKSLSYRLCSNKNIENDIKGTNEINDQQPQKFATVSEITRCEYLNVHSNEKEATNFESFVNTTSSDSLQNNSNKTKHKLHSEQKELSLEANKTNLYIPNESMDNTQDSLQLLPSSVIEGGCDSLLLTEKYTSECVEGRNGGAVQVNRSDFNFCKPHPVEQSQTKCLKFPVPSSEASPSDFNGHVSSRSITHEEKSSRTRSVNNTVSTCSNFAGMEHSEAEFVKFPDLANKTSTSDFNEHTSASSRNIVLEEKSSRVRSGNSLVSNNHKLSTVKFTHCSNETSSSDINELLPDNSENNVHRKETSHAVSENISTLLPDSLDRSRSALERSKIFSEKRVLLDHPVTSSTKKPVLMENPANNIHLSSMENTSFKTNTIEDGNALHLEEKNESNASDEQCNVNPSDNLDVPENGLMSNLTGEERITTVLKEKRKYLLSKTRNQSQKHMEECDKSLFISTNNSNKKAFTECDSRNIPVSSVPSSEISQIDVTSKDAQEITNELVPNEYEDHTSEVTLQNGSKLQVLKYSDEACVDKIRLFEKNDEKMFSDDQRNSSHMQENNQVENVNKNQTEHNISVQTVAEIPEKNDEPYDEHVIEDQIMKELFKAIGDATSQNCLWEIKELNKLKIVVSFIWKTLLVSISFGEKQSIRQDKTLQFFKEVSDISFESKFGVVTLDVVQLSHSLFHKALEDTNLKEKYSNSSLVLQLLQHLSSAASRAEMLILDVEHILIRHTFFLQNNSEFGVEVLSLGLDTKYLLLFPLQIESYPFQKIVPTVQHMIGNTLSEAKMKEVMAEVIPGENYMWRMVKAVEDLFRALCK